MRRSSPGPLSSARQECRVSSFTDIRQRGTRLTIPAPGRTAYWSFYNIGKPKKGETIFVSAASRSALP